MSNSTPKLTMEGMGDCNIPWMNDSTMVVNLDIDEVPSIKLSHIPECTIFAVFYKHFFISSPPFCKGEGNVGVHLNHHIGDPFDEQDPNPFNDYWMNTIYFVDGRDFTELGVPFVFLNIPNDTLDNIIEEAKKLIDDFWTKNRAILDELDQIDD